MTVSTIVISDWIPWIKLKSFVVKMNCLFVAKIMLFFALTGKLDLTF